MALRGLKVIEIAGLAPAPFCGMILSDFGANVIRVEKPGQPPIDPLRRGKRSAVIDLKKDSGKDVFKSLCKDADVLIEPFRPGVMERLNLGPKTMLALNSRLIFARLSGFGQEGPYAKKPGHDINYLAMSGVLSRMTSAGRPTPPMNFLADFAGGGLTCAVGILIALYERQKSNLGQVIDVNMVDGTKYLSSYLWQTMADENTCSFIWPRKESTEANLLDGGAPFYTCYETKDNRWISVGCIEPQFYETFLQILNITSNEYPQFDIKNWPSYKTKFSKIFKSKSLEEWTKLFADTDACVEPVLNEDEVIELDEKLGTHSFLEDKTPAPTPRLSRTPAVPNIKKPTGNENTLDILREHGYSLEEIKKLNKEKIIELSEQSKL